MISICVGSTLDGYRSSEHPPLVGTNAFGMLRLGDPERVGSGAAFGL
jgi:hypothetical protein